MVFFKVPTKIIVSMSKLLVELLYIYINSSKALDDNGVMPLFPPDSLPGVCAYNFV